MQLNQQQLDNYYQRGWLIVEDVFTKTEAKSIADLALRRSQAELLKHDDSDRTDTTDFDEAGMPVPRKLDHPFLKDSAFRTFALDQRLQSLVSQLIGQLPLLVVDQIFMKPPQIGTGKPWHQDNAYFQCAPADEVLTAWIALDDADESNGCLQYIDGSHQRGILDHTPVPGEPHNRAPAPHLVDASRRSPACVRRGGVAFHHSQTLHTSLRNDSNRWRRAYATHWASAAVSSDVSTIDNAYYNTASELYSQAMNT